MMNSNIVLLKSSEIDRASDILARAFNEDPMFRYLTPEAEQPRVNVIKWFCGISLRNCQTYNHIYRTAGDLKGVAAWTPPGKPEMNIWQILSMLFALPGKCGWHRLGRWLSLLYALNERSQKEMTKPHWILSFLGVAPTYQGQQIGSLLLQPVLEQADKEGLPCYLFTSTEQAVHFYQKHGFVVLWQGELSGGSPCIWTMKREPQPLQLKLYGRSIERP